MGHFRFPNDLLLLAQLSQKAIHGFSRSLISLLFDLLPKLQAILTSLLPSFEHIPSIRVKNASPFATPLGFREISLFDPPFECSSAETNTTSNFCDTQTLFAQGHHLLIPVVALGTTTEAGSFVPGFWRFLPILSSIYLNPP